MNWTKGAIGLAAGLASLSVLAPAAQAEAPQWHAAAIGGLERTDSQPGAGANDGFYYGGQVGADWKLRSVRAGFELELGDSTAVSSNSGNPARQSLFAYAAARLAVPLGGGTRVFVRGGYAYHRIDYATGPAFEGHGYTVGGGGEVDLGESWYVRGEYRFSDYGRTVRGQHFVGGVGIRF